VVDLRSGRTRWRRCEPFRILVTSVKDTFPFGVAVQAYIDPLWEPSRKRYTPRRHYSKPNWLDSQPNLFDAFGSTLSPRNALPVEIRTAWTSQVALSATMGSAK
jgi:hypothetical protein